MTSSWFFLSTLNYDARSTTHQIYNDKHNAGLSFLHIYNKSHVLFPLEYITLPVTRIQAIAARCPCSYFYTRHQYIDKNKAEYTRRNKKSLPWFMDTQQFLPTISRSVLEGSKQVTDRMTHPEQHAWGTLRHILKVFLNILQTCGEKIYLH